MMGKFAVAALLVAAYALPASAQSYYIVQDSKTKHCQIVDQRPVATTTTTVGPDGVVYKTRDEAETAMRTVKICHED